ncbi:MAG: SPFH domain-containing protein [Eubacterium sp.]|nr:SPFH domain-containing protein [Eubacterium sp.]
MGLFSGQLANVVEWEEYRDDVIFYKWDNAEIKKGSRLIIRPGQDAIFLHNGKVEGVFKDDGTYDIESQIIPFLSTLKGFKFGFNSGMRAEVLFINTKEFVMKWGTKSAINLPHPALPGGMPIRANGNFQFKVADYDALIEKVAGVKKQYTTAEVRDRVISMLDQLLLRWIVREGKDMFNIQANAVEISEGIRTELDMEMIKIGLTITGFQINSVSYPEEVQKMVTKVAGQSMIGDVGKYQQVAMADAIAAGNGGGSMAADMASMQVGMMMGQQMAGQMAQNFGGQQAGYQGQYNQAAPAGQFGQPGAQGFAQQPAAQGASPAAGGGPKFCPECGTPTNGAKFCANCGTKLV